MSEALQVIEGAMRADAEAVRIIAQNIANSGVTAYQRQIPLSPGAFATALDDSSAVASALTVAMDFQPGPLRSTAEPLHMALDGSGFFVISGSDGMRLTRRGDFEVSADGVLVTAAGDVVLGDNGAIQLGSATPVVSVDGTVSIDDQAIDRLRIVNVSKLDALAYRGDGTFAIGPEQQLLESAAAVRQGYLEGSNVTPVGEMMQLMEMVRHFEAAQRFVRGYDDLMQKAISELGKVG
jgi:flagellar basal-body rod protein FlgG